MGMNDISDGGKKKKKQNDAYDKSIEPDHNVP
jgi:hypothetical protein